MADSLSIQRETIREDAVAKHAEFPQYGDGYWNGWQLAELKRPVRFKSGTMQAGEQVIVRPTPQRELPRVCGASVDAYSAKKGHHVALPTTVVRFLTGPTS